MKSTGTPGLDNSREVTPSLVTSKCTTRTRLLKRYKVFIKQTRNQQDFHKLDSSRIFQGHIYRSQWFSLCKELNGLERVSFPPPQEKLGPPGRDPRAGWPRCAAGNKGTPVCGTLWQLLGPRRVRATPPGGPRHSVRKSKVPEHKWGLREGWMASHPIQ